MRSENDCGTGCGRVQTEGSGYCEVCASIPDEVRQGTGWWNVSKSRVVFGSHEIAFERSRVRNEDLIFFSTFEPGFGCNCGFVPNLELSFETIQACKDVAYCVLTGHKFGSEE